MFFEAPEALPSRGSIPSVHAVDPDFEAARREAIESQQHPFVQGGPTSSATPADTVRPLSPNQLCVPCALPLRQWRVPLPNNSDYAPWFGWHVLRLCLPLSLETLIL